MVWYVRMKCRRQASLDRNLELDTRNRAQGLSTRILAGLFVVPWRQTELYCWCCFQLVQVMQVLECVPVHILTFSFPLLWKVVWGKVDWDHNTASLVSADVCVELVYHLSDSDCARYLAAERRITLEATTTWLQRFKNKRSTKQF